MIATKFRALTACALLWALPASAASSVKASSEYKDPEGTTHRAAMAFDGHLQTAWIQDNEDGELPWLELGLDRTRTIESVSIWPGELSRGRRSLRTHARAKTVTLIFSGTGGDDVEIEARIPDFSDAAPGRADIRLEEPVQASRLRIRVEEVYPNFVDERAAIAEVAVNFVSGEVPSQVDKTLGWLDSDAGKRSLEREKERVEELFAALSDNDEDREALDELIAFSADGLAALHSRATSVPYGFRVHAVPSSDIAVEALLKLKNPNGIPGVELAAARARAKSQKALELKTEMFYAYQELLGGASPVPNWGRSGWEPGALRGFGEPLNLEADSLGQTYVADIGNHRVQRFDDQGALVGTWGACDAPDIANRWFLGTRAFYVTGCLPSEADGGFVNPLDVAVIPGKDGDSFAVLDVTGRIQVFDGDGKHLRSFDSDLGSSPAAGVGGQGFLEYVKGRLVAVLGDEVGVYSLTGIREAQFVLEYGGASGVVGLKNGKLGLIQGRELVMFSLDGFEHGPILGEAELGTDFEYWDVALDDSKRLWVLTDSGRALKFKKPGKLEWEGTFEGNTAKPRFHVINGVLFVLQDDAITLTNTGTGS
ncbi:MAG: hypothetical protein EP330_12935 [Deltaproteobacteria bacterium]|nr:MAG: hypothetical protein EP330_12935 [Deltaproteobacteria bacterium]